MKAIVDTNVLLVANGKHSNVSVECHEKCINSLVELQAGITVIDDGNRILSEYGRKTQPNAPVGVGDVFLKFLLRNTANAKRVEQVSLTETSPDTFAEFPDQHLEAQFDPPDRKFVAVAHAHSDKPPIWQATDCKWLEWWPQLINHGIQVDFLCPADVCEFYQKKFPQKSPPDLPKN